MVVKRLPTFYLRLFKASKIMLERILPFFWGHPVYTVEPFPLYTQLSKERECSRCIPSLVRNGNVPAVYLGEWICKPRSLPAVL